jgi:hypothetical protein
MELNTRTKPMEEVIKFVNTNESVVVDFVIVRK